MRLGEYLGAKGVTLCFLAIGGLMMAAMMFIVDLHGDLVMLAAGLYVLLILIWLTVGYVLQRRRFLALQNLAEELPQQYLLGEMVHKPVNEIEKYYFELMKTVSRAAIGAVEQAKREKEEYCDYVESWIHEIKTPLTACSLILANQGDTGKLKKELRCADNLAESILYYARMRTAEKDTKIQKIQVADVIGEAVKSQMEILIASGIRVEVYGDFAVHTDKKALCFMLKQLLINSAKYCPGCTIIIRAEEGRIIVEDDGIGIPSHEVKRVTERGFTGTNGRKCGSSTGMGLYLVHELGGRLGIGLEICAVQDAFTRVTLSFLG